MSEETPVVEASPVIEATPPKPDPTKAVQFVGDVVMEAEMRELLTQTFQMPIHLKDGGEVTFVVNLALLQPLLMRLDGYSQVWKAVGQCVVDELGLGGLLAMVGKPNR